MKTIKFVMLLCVSILGLSSCSTYRLANGVAVFARSGAAAKEVYAGQNVVNRYNQNMGARISYSTRLNYVYNFNCGWFSFVCHGDNIFVSYNKSSETVYKWTAGKRYYSNGYKRVILNTGPYMCEVVVEKKSPTTQNWVLAGKMTIDTRKGRRY